MRLVVSLLLGAALLASPRTGSAKEMPTFNPAVVCAQSLEDKHGDLSASLVERYLNEQPLCLVRLPTFAGTSFELTPRATKKRWGASLELRF